MAIVHATEESFDTLVQEGVSLVDFWAPWCGPCKMLGRVLEEIDDELPFLNIVKVDVDQCPGLAERFQVDGIPDLLYYKDGKKVDRDLGAVPPEHIKEKLAAILY